MLRHGAELDDERRRALKALVRERISPRHVPDDILQIAEVPRTLNGKKLEVPVKRLLQGVPLDAAVSRGSVANPQSLEPFAQLGQLGPAASAVQARREGVAAVLARNRR